MLSIFCNNNYKPEREYICQVLLSEFLGIEYEIEFQARKDWLITDSEKNIKMSLPDVLFQTPPEGWLTEGSLPSQPLEIWDASKNNFHCTLVDKKIPVIYGVMNNPNYSIPIDIFGSAFFMLTRYEEVVKKIRDSHDRFSAAASLAFQEFFLDRPIIDEYLEILWWRLKKMQPDLERNKRQFKILSTHDVDIPFYLLLKKPNHMAIKLLGDLIIRKDPFLSINNAINWFKVKKNISLDQYNTFDYIMDTCDQHNIKAAFYFIADIPAGKIDGDYSIEHPLIKNLIQHIYKRGHEIGLHTSYNTYKDKYQTIKEFKKLSYICSQLEIKQNNWGSRQHFLRWETPTTAVNLDHAGLNYDTSISFADHAGFRCGTCYEYPLFDLKNRKALKLCERPLIMMECSVIDERYMNLGAGEESLKMMKKLKDRRRMFNGNFTMLWHNSRLVNMKERFIFEQLLKA
jgi:hypothetical protein